MPVISAHVIDSVPMGQIMLSLENCQPVGKKKKKKREREASLFVNLPVKLREKQCTSIFFERGGQMGHFTCFMVAKR